MLEALQADASTTTVQLCDLPRADIEIMDFFMIKLKLQDSEEGPGWTPEVCDAVEKEYKRFLALKRAYTDREIVPNKLVDIFWHQHILDTAKYVSDCENLFGHFLHHYPYFGMQGVDDYANLCSAFEETKVLYELHFGEALELADKARCRTQCKPVKCR
jgi:hypothetical protein